MPEEKTTGKTTLDEAVAAAEKEVLTINRAQFVEAVAEVVTEEPIGDIVSKNPMLIMLFGVMQRVLWEKCVELTTPHDITDNNEEKEVTD